ncbi:hypothetical protein [Flavicella sediminum]|uniref:hypothetical protein n=1 Tax=Flavicella sediminum TaxID=2585141 RepID=UPI0014093742|nr:hypothetical protein [Flavicella sediminum]
MKSVYSFERLEIRKSYPKAAYQIGNRILELTSVVSYFIKIAAVVFAKSGQKQLTI